MSKHLPAVLICTAALAGCATAVAPVNFELVDERAAIHKGTLDPARQGMTVAVGERTYTGFYVVATDNVTTTAIPTFSRRWFPSETRSSVTSNIARAHLRSADGSHLSCEFMYEGERAVGSCRTQAGVAYQFVAGN